MLILSTKMAEYSCERIRIELVGVWNFVRIAGAKNREPLMWGLRVVYIEIKIWPNLTRFLRSGGVFDLVHTESCPLFQGWRWTWADSWLSWSFFFWRSCCDDLTDKCTNPPFSGRLLDMASGLPNFKANLLSWLRQPTGPY